MLSASAQRQLKTIGDADVVIGLPTYKNPAAAAHVARIALAGVEKHYPHLRTVLLNADAGRNPATRRAVLAQSTDQSTIISSRYQGKLGRGAATAALLDAALALDAKAIIILDSHTQSIQPDWLAALAHLILENKASLVTPRYHWSEPDGALSDLIVYPLFRALWGVGTRHPAAPDFALAPELATAILDEDVWETEVAAYGLPIWLNTFATTRHWPVAQSALGEKITQRSHPYFQSAMTVLLRSATVYHHHWRDISTFEAPSTLTRFGTPCRPARLSAPDPTALLDALAIGWMDYRRLWQRILNPDHLAHIEALASLPPDSFYFPNDLWARILYDFTVVFNKGDCDPYQVVRALYPLYQGRLAAFQQEIAGLTWAGREGVIAAQALEFEEMRPYFRIRWHTYQPVNL